MSAATPFLIPFAAFGAGTGLAEIFGATNLGTAMGIGQIGFAAAVVWVLLRY